MKLSECERERERLTESPGLLVSREDDHDRHDDNAHEEVGKSETQNEVVARRRQKTRLELDCQQDHSVSFVLFFRRNYY